MKKLFLLALTCISTFSLFAQPTLTSADAPKIGDTYTVQQLNPNNFDASSSGASGANQTWDFSAIPTTGSSGGSSVVAPSATSYSGDFPSANIADGDGDDYEYVNVSSSQEVLYGTEGVGDDEIFTDPETVFTFPFTYNSSLTDNFSGNGTSSAPFSVTGSVKAKGDAYGTLKIPAGTYTNTLRVKVAQTIHDDFGSGITFDYHITTYDWYMNGYSNYLFTLTYDTTIINYSGLLDTSIDISGVEALNATATAVNSVEPNLSLTVFPTLTTNHVFVKASEEINTVIITNMLGEKVKEAEQNNVEPGNPVEISFADLPAGIYFCTINTPLGNATRKIVKE